MTDWLPVTTSQLTGLRFGSKVRAVGSTDREWVKAAPDYWQEFDAAGIHLRSASRPGIDGPMEYRHPLPKVFTVLDRGMVACQCGKRFVPLQRHAGGEATCQKCGTQGTWR